MSWFTSGLHKNYFPLIKTSYTINWDCSEIRLGEPWLVSSARAHLKNDFLNWRYFMEKKIVVVENGPKAIGPYSLGVKAGQLMFVSGQLGLDPGTGALVAGGVEAETRQALKNLKAILEAGGCSLNQVVKTTVFMQDINDFGRMNIVYAEFFTENPPARSTVQVAALPRNGAIEIEVIALL
jgi:2-iminobutanoate/2-iminopropanoate deaminase